MDKRVFQIALSLLHNVGPIKAKSLVKNLGGIEALFKESDHALSKVDGLNATIVGKLNREEAIVRAEAELNFIEKNGIDLFYYEDKRYPTKLKYCADGPIVLFTKGNVNFNQRNISIVGTRKISPYGRKMTQKLVEDLKDFGIQIISGLAHGIDVEAHRSALQNGMSTLGVLGHGLDTMYPAVHRPIAIEMLDKGGLVTEFVSQTPGDPSHFPRRNRIVAGLSQATVVVESTESGGSLITANLANDYNRDVFAFPGDVNRPTSKGCNNLIRRDKAHLITNADEMLEVLGWNTDDNAFQTQTNLFNELNEEEEQIINVFMEKGELDIDNLSFSTKMKSSELSLHLFNLEMKGVVKSSPGKKYALI